MASKLREDQIKWILSLDAKGVQGEVQTLSNGIRNLKDENSRLNKEIKDVNKQMSEAEKEMKKLEKVGLTQSNAYKELKGTYESAKTELNDYKSKVLENNNAIEEQTKKLNTTIESMRIEDMTMSQLKKTAGQLQAQMNNTSLAADPKRYKELQDQLGKVQGRMVEVKGANMSLGQQLAGLPGPAGAAVKGIQGLGSALKALIANPVGVVIMAIVVVFMAFKKAINSSEEATNKFNQILAPLGALLDWLMNILQKVVGAYLDFIAAAIEWMMKLAEKLPFVGEKMKQINEKAAEAIQLEKDKQELEKRKRQFLEKDAKYELDISKLRNEIKQKDIFAEEERLKKIEEVMNLAKERAETEREIALENSRLMELEASRTQNTTEKERILAQARADKHKAETDYYKKTMELASEKAALVAEIEREKEEAQKKRIENQIKKEEQAYIKEVTELKKMLLANQITRQNYDKAIEQAEIKSLENRLRIAGLEPEKRAQIEQQLIDLRLAANDKADKAMLDALKKDRDSKRKILEQSHQFALQKLQEEETDKAIIAVKTAAIDAEFAQKRLELAQSMGEALQQAEFRNGELKAQAITENSETIVAADTEVNQARLAANKVFAEQAAAIEASIKTVTLEESKQAELDALKKLYDEKLISDETYQIAKKAIEDKYDEEKLAARQAWNISTLEEQFQYEMEELRRQHSEKLLSEEEFERARLQLKLNYAQQYAQQAQQLTQAGANAVNAIQQAQLAKAGDNEAKKLEIQKKFADAQFAMQVAQIVASTAQGIMAAWASAMILGPIAGPIAGVALAALLATTSVAQIAAANAERQRIKSLTLKGSSAGESKAPNQSNPIAAKMVVNSGFADGGYTGRGDKYEVAGYLPDGRPYHKGEYFVAQEELSHPEVAPLVRKIESVRRRRTNSNPLPEGFADGGYTSPDQGNFNTILNRIANLLEDLKNEPIKAELNYYEFNETKELIDSTKKNSSLS